MNRIKSFFSPILIFVLSIILLFSIVINIYLVYFQITFFSRKYVLFLSLMIILFGWMIFIFLKRLYFRFGKKCFLLLLVIPFLVSLLLNLIVPTIANIEPKTYYLSDVHTVEITFMSDEYSTVKFEGIQMGENWVSYSNLSFIGDWNFEGNDCIGIIDGEPITITWIGKTIEPLLINFQWTSGNGVVNILWDDASNQVSLKGGGNYTFYEISFPSNTQSVFISRLLKLLFSFSINFILVSIAIGLILSKRRMDLESKNLIVMNQSKRIVRIFTIVTLLISLSFFSINFSYEWGKRSSSFFDWQQYYIDPMEEAIDLLTEGEKVLLEEPRFAYYLREDAPILLMYSEPTLSLIQTENMQEVSHAMKENRIGIVILFEDNVSKVWEETAIFQFLEDERYSQMIYKSPSMVTYMPFRIYRVLPQN